MMIHSFRARLGRALSACAVALFTSAAVATADAQQEPDADARATRPTSIRPTTMLTTRPGIQAADVPAVRLASPRPFALQIGSGYRLLKLSGTHLDRVTVAAVVTPDGQDANGFKVRIPSRGRSNDRLSLSLIAGKPVAPGDYSLRLVYELDDPRPQTSPTSARRKPIVRSVVVPGSTLTIHAQQMEASIAGITPEPLKIGQDYTMIRVKVIDLPGKEFVSVSRQEIMPADPRYCDFAGTYHSPEESLSTAWLGEHSLEIRFSPGRLIPLTGRSCLLRFAVRTENELGEEFYSLLDKWLEFQPADPDPRRAYRVSNTRDLKKYVAFDEEPYNVGVCSGTSPGTSGFIPVGVINAGRDVALRIRSGPIGTKCTWMIYATGLRDGWQLRMTFEEQPVGSKCGPGIETSAGGSYSFDRMAPLYFQGGTLTLSGNNPQGEIPPYDMESAKKFFRYLYLSCSPTVTNDHGVTLRMVSAELYGDGGPDCTWRCGVID